VEATVVIWRAYGRVYFADGAVISAFVLLGPLWAIFFFMFYDWLLYPFIGAILILFALGLTAALAAHQSRASRT